MDFNESLDYMNLSVEKIKQNPEVLMHVYCEKAKILTGNETEFHNLNEAHTNIAKKYFENLLVENSRHATADENVLEDYENNLLVEEALHYQNNGIIKNLVQQIELLKKKYYITVKPIKNIVTSFLESQQEIYANMLMEFEDQDYEFVLPLLVFMEQKYEDLSLNIVLKKIVNETEKSKLLKMNR